MEISSDCWGQESISKFSIIFVLLSLIFLQLHFAWKPKKHMWHKNFWVKRNCWWLQIIQIEISDNKSHFVLTHNCWLIDEFGWSIIIFQQHGKQQSIIEAEKEPTQLKTYVQKTDHQKNEEGNLCTPLKPIHNFLHKIDVCILRINMWLILSITLICCISFNTRIQLFYLFKRLCSSVEILN